MTAKVVVTGGSGRLGRLVISEFLTHGWDVLSLDRVPSSPKPCTSWVADLTRLGDVYQALHGADAVVHLAAWEAPNLAPDAETFTNNVTATYNVLKAGSDLGVRRVVLASSVAAYGYLYAPSLDAPEYLPVDEVHPCRPRDPYGLSKVVGERIADAFAQGSTPSVISLRFPGVNFDSSFGTFPDRWREPARRARGFWSYIDGRDAAVACALAVTASSTGHVVFNVAAPDNGMTHETMDLVTQYLPAMPEIRRPAAGRWSGVDSSRAERVLGFRAEHTLERYLPHLRQ